MIPYNKEDRSENKRREYYTHAMFFLLPPAAGEKEYQVKHQDDGNV